MTFYVEFALSLMLVLLGIIVIGEGVLAFGSGDILHLTRYIWPGLFFISLFGLNSALLQARGKFFLTGIAPLIFNGVWIMGIIISHAYGGLRAMERLCIAVVLGFMSQWLVTLPHTYREVKKAFLIDGDAKSWREVGIPRPFSPRVKKAIFPFLLGTIGVAAAQINGVLDALFARIASAAGPAYLWYANRLYQAPMALFGVACFTSLLPALSRAHQKGDEESFTTLLQGSITRAIHWMVPATFALFLFGQMGIELVYAHGHFSPLAARQTLWSLWGYGVGLTPAVLTLLLISSFYGRRDYKTPMKSSLLAVGVNILANAFFLFVCGWGVMSIALATSLSSYVQFFTLRRALINTLHKGSPSEEGGEQETRALGIGLLLGIAASMGSLVMATVLKRMDIEMLLVRSLLQGFSFMGVFIALGSYLGVVDLSVLFHRRKRGA